MESNDKELFSENLRARSRKYYFDIKENRSGNKYVTISETQPKNPHFKRMRIMIFEEYIESFIEKLTEFKEKLNEMPSNANKVNNRNYNQFPDDIK